MADESIEADVVKRRRWIGNGTATFVVSILVVVLFGCYIFAITFFVAVPTMTKEQQGIILGVLVSAFASVVGYYVGSSIGSANKSIELAGKK